MNTQQQRPADRPIICLGFDGVIHSSTSVYSGPAYVADPPTEGAIDFLLEAVKHFRVSIFSHRSTEAGGMQAMSAWLMYHATQKIGIDNAKQLMRHIAFPRTKPMALVTIDNRVIRFEGTWPTMEAITTFKVK